VVTFALLIWDGVQPALTFIEEIGRRLDEAGVPGAALDCRAEAVQGNVLAGRPADAVARAEELLEQPAPLRARQTATIFRARALGLMGLFDEAARTLREVEAAVTSDFVGLGELTATYADLALWGGLTDRAIELVEAVRKIASPIFGAYTLPEITRAWAQFDAGLAPEPASGILAAPAQAGAPFEMEGLRLLHAGDPTTAAARFHDAAGAWAGFNVPRELFCRWAEGEALRRAGQEEPMLECLEAALETAIACRIETVAVRIRRSLRQAGRRVAAGDRGPKVTRLGLTHRERQLLDLVGQGLNNAEIARRMGLGRPTVARILSNAMVKLGAVSRGQAVKLVADDV
jgi:DNA-binding CsgD family transcriptional regulator